MSKLIEAVAFDHRDNEEYRADFESVKEARAFIKEAMLNPSFWDRRAEVAGYAENIATVQLIVDGEIKQDWFPQFKPAVVKLGNLVWENRNENDADGVASMTTGAWGKGEY